MIIQKIPHILISARSAEQEDEVFEHLAAFLQHGLGCGDRKHLC
jgi:hypothetical protein